MPPRAACGLGVMRGSSSHPLFRSLVGCGSPWPRVRGVPSSGSGPAGDSWREAADELDAPSVAWWGPVWSAACRAWCAGVGKVGMCVCSVRGLLDWRRGSAADDVCRAGGLLGPPRPLSAPSWKKTRRAGGDRRAAVVPGSVRVPCFLVRVWRAALHPWGMRATSVPPRGEWLEGASVCAAGGTHTG